MSQEPDPLVVPEGQSPFFRFTCGCVGIPLERPGRHVAGSMLTIIVRACDGDRDPEGQFGFRDLDLAKVRNAVRLTTAETDAVVAMVGYLVRMGHRYEGIGQLLVPDEAGRQACLDAARTLARGSG